MSDIEPPTQGFSVLCSTNWATTPKIVVLSRFELKLREPKSLVLPLHHRTITNTLFVFLYGWHDSNLRHLHPKCSILLTELHHVKIKTFNVLWWIIECLIYKLVKMNSIFSPYVFPTLMFKCSMLIKKGHSGSCKNNILPNIINMSKINRIHFVVYFFELNVGLEPTTCWLQISCSTNWANSAFMRFMRESNPHHTIDSRVS